MSDNYVPGKGPIGAKLLVLGDSPDPQDVKSKQPFVGSSGLEFKRMCREQGINPDNFWYTYVSKYPIRPNAPKMKIPFFKRAEMDGVDLTSQIRDLYEEIEAVNPNMILCLGKNALYTLTNKDGIGEWRGSILPWRSRKLISTYHPRNLYSYTDLEFLGYWNRYVMQWDVKRAYEQAQFKDLNLPVRHLQICNNSAELRNFYERWKHKRLLSVDIEARGKCIPVCVGLSFDKTHGITVPLWNNLENSGLMNTTDSDMAVTWILLQEIFDNHDICGQNFNYDFDKMKRLGFRFKSIAEDVMLKAFAINPELPKGLAFNQSVYTLEPYYKNEGMYEGSLHDLFEGCARDACVTIEICEKMDSELEQIHQKDFYYEFLMKLPAVYREIESTGFVVDYEKRDALLRKYIEWAERINYALYKIVGAPVNVQSPKQVATLLFEVWKLPKRSGTGEEELSAMLNLKSFTDSTKRRGVELILENRRVLKTIGTYIQAIADYDGRMKTTCFPCLETGRSNTGKQDEPIRPSLKFKIDGKTKEKSMGAAFQTVTKHGDIGQDIRGMYGPDKGYVLVNIDSSQAEARVTSLLAKDSKMLGMYDTNDIHALTASWFLGGTESDYSKKLLGYECPERFLGKTLRHSGERGARGKRAMIEVNTSARKYKIKIEIDEAEAQRALDVFHAMCPNIKQVYFAECEDIIGRTRTLIAPLPYGVKSDFGGRRTFYERKGDELLRKALSYIPQRAVTDNTKNAAIRIKPRAPYARLVCESHDALLYMVPERELNEFVLIAKSEMERPIDFNNCSISRGLLSIPSDVEIGYNWMDLRKYKHATNDIG